MKFLAVIPARYESSRFPGKPLAKIQNKPMIQWVYEEASKSTVFKSVVVATDDQKIFDVCRDFGAEVMMTSLHHQSGTDRIAEVCQGASADYVVNIQGDEPLLNIEILNKLCETVEIIPEIRMASLAREIKQEELHNPNVVKVKLQEPFIKTDCAYAERFLREIKNDTNDIYYAHIGIYLYSMRFLFDFAQMEKTGGEKELRLEQLRALESGIPIGIRLVNYDGFGVDTKEDLIKAEKVLNDKKNQN